MTGADDLVLREQTGGVRTLTLNRPEARNALSLAMLHALQGELTAADADRSVRVVVLAGNGPAFSAGHDLREIGGDDDPERHRELFETCSDVMVQIAELSQPVIASVAGVATAAGCQLVATCDLAVAGRSARFATPGVDIGLFCSTPMVAVTRAIAPKHAMELLLTGELVDAETAWRMGLINRMVDDEDLAEATMSLAEKVASKSAAVVAAGKATYRRQLDRSLADAYGIASTAMVDGLAHPDAKEGIGAFLDKRPPNWSES
ncbi:MAG: enoyl-CoA hydratase [Aquihabitans sp.]